MSTHDPQSSESVRPRRLVTPILVKSEKDDPWPEGERLFYLLARDGLYLCRQHEFFRSCVKVEGGPSELLAHREIFEPRFPTIPRSLIERAVGFHTQIAELHGSESAALFAWDPREQRVKLVVPYQTATMSGYRYPIGVHYHPPTTLPEDWVIFGDIHCHVSYAAYASHTDVEDEFHSAGLHIVVGRIWNDPPEFHVEAVVDGQRFRLDLDEISGGYASRRMKVPSQWISRVDIAVPKWGSGSSLYPAS